MVFNSRGLDKYGSKHTGSQKNIQANIGGTYEQIRTDGVDIQEGTVRVYILEGKDMRTIHLNDQTYLWYKLISSLLKQFRYQAQKLNYSRGEELSTSNRELLVSLQIH